MTHKDFKLSVDVGGDALAALPAAASTAPAAISPPSSAAPVMWWDGGERAITVREKVLIEEHSESCFSIPLVPATSSIGEHPVAWLIRWRDVNATTGEAIERRSVFLHNAVADFRTVDPEANVAPLYGAPPTQGVAARDAAFSDGVISALTTLQLLGMGRGCSYHTEIVNSHGRPQLVARALITGNAEAAGLVDQRETRTEAGRG